MATPAQAVQPVDPIKIAANDIAAAADTDVYLYNSRIVRPYDDTLIGECCSRKRRSNVMLILVTEGGDPDAAYRIARCFQSLWKKFTCVVSGYCKSAGTLIATGAHELVIADAGELGPLDIQMSKKDEIWESQSGLTVMAALDALKEKAFSAFEHSFLEIKKRSNNTVTFKTAAEIAVKLSAGLFNPVFQQIDPMHVGEASRAQAIAKHYSMRLAYYGKNISDSSLESLIGEYPAHGFVIDRSEADGLFNSVREPNEAETRLIRAMGASATDPARDTKGNVTRTFLSDERGENENVTANSTEPVATGPELGATTEVAREGTEQENLASRSATAS